MDATAQPLAAPAVERRVRTVHYPFGRRSSRVWKPLYASPPGRARTLDATYPALAPRSVCETCPLISSVFFSQSCLFPNHHNHAEDTNTTPSEIDTNSHSDISGQQHPQPCPRRHTAGSAAHSLQRRAGRLANRRQVRSRHHRPTRRPATRRHSWPRARSSSALRRRRSATTAAAPMATPWTCRRLCAR